ncbi:hypothetical protein A2U01_0082110, partial [Trifolium medium]|nr:hypothetical protein [Trifolium medium]
MARLMTARRARWSFAGRDSSPYLAIPARNPGTFWTCFARFRWARPSERA